jgi:hypothetical protein
LQHKYLAKLIALPVMFWKYLPAIDPKQLEHIGPMADDWKRITGMGDGLTIDPVDANGFIIKAVQELSAKVDALTSEVERLKKEQS